MNAEPWKKWTAQFIRDASADAHNTGFPPWADMLEAFAALLESEQRGERCVLPRELKGKELGVWKSLAHSQIVADCGGDEVGMADTQEAAILDLARKLRSR